MDFAVIVWSSFLVYFNLITGVHGSSCSDLYKCPREPKDILEIEVNCIDNSNVFVKWSLKSANSNEDLSLIILEYSCYNISRSGNQLPGYPAILGAVDHSTEFNGDTSISNLPISKDVECTFGGCVEIFGDYRDCWQPNIDAAMCNYTESTSSHISPTSTTFSNDIIISVMDKSRSVKSALILMSSPLISSVNSPFTLSFSSTSQSTKFESLAVVMFSSLVSMTPESISPSDRNVTFTLVIIMSSGVALIICLCGLILIACLLNYYRWKQKTNITQRNDENMENGWFDIIFKIDDISTTESIITIENQLSVETLQNKQHKEKSIDVNSNIKSTSDLKQSIIPSISQSSISNKYIESVICPEFAVAGNNEAQNDTTSNIKEMPSSTPDSVMSENGPLTCPANSQSLFCPMNDSGYLSSSNITFGITHCSGNVQQSTNSGERDSLDDAYDFIMEIINNKNDEEVQEEIDESDVSYSCG